VAYAKQARSDPDDPTRWTDAQPSEVRPSSRPSFHGPVVELTGIHSVSAAETFTQALLKRMPKVTRIGENTQGVFSDVLTRRLPNGWTFGLPNERFVTDGKTYDVAGIAPDVAVPAADALTEALVRAGLDRAEVVEVDPDELARLRDLLAIEPDLVAESHRAQPTQPTPGLCSIPCPRPPPATASWRA
jgi:C-terminal processing protease CtpA/Prc